jgi:hypothetical protein
MFEGVVTKLREGWSPSRRRLLVPVLAVSLGLVAAAEVDIQRRPAAAVRGNRLLWRLLCLNALGALAYFGCGRRSTPD